MDLFMAAIKEFSLSCNDYFSLFGSGNKTISETHLDSVTVVLKYPYPC